MSRLILTVAQMLSVWQLPDQRALSVSIPPEANAAAKDLLCLSVSDTPVVLEVELPVLVLPQGPTCFLLVERFCATSEQGKQITVPLMVKSTEHSSLSCPVQPSCKLLSLVPTSSGRHFQSLAQSGMELLCPSGYSGSSSESKVGSYAPPSWERKP